MSSVENRMFIREHFPIPVYGDGDFGRIEIPPYHPTMAENGINFEIVPDIVEKAVADSINDLRDISDESPVARRMLKILEKNPRVPVIESQDELGIRYVDVPIAGTFFVGRGGINPYSYGGDGGIIITDKHKRKGFNVSLDVVFPIELMNEYEMTETSVSDLFGREIKTPFNWYRHNLDDNSAILYKNLVMAIVNDVVMKKYSQSD